MMRLYIDGVEVGSRAETRKLNPSTHGPAFGTGLHEFDGNIHGLIDEVSMYDRALTANEILAIYNADIAGKCK